MVGLKSDLECVIDKEKIHNVKSEIEADGYVEVSALKRINVDKVFETAMTNYFKPKPQKKKVITCMLL